MEMFVLCYIVFMIITGVMASNRDRSILGWVLLAFLISPLLAWILLACLGQGNSKKCPRCAELVKNEACLCRHCGHEFRTPYHGIEPMRLPSTAPAPYPNEHGSFWNPTPSENMARRFPNQS